MKIWETALKLQQYNYLLKEVATAVAIVLFVATLLVSFAWLCIQVAR